MAVWASCKFYTISDWSIKLVSCCTASGKFNLTGDSSLTSISYTWLLSVEWVRECKAAHGRTWQIQLPHMYTGFSVGHPEPATLVEGKWIWIDHTVTSMLVGGRLGRSADWTPVRTFLQNVKKGKLMDTKSHDGFSDCALLYLTRPHLYPM
jgi:hypothetical protein